MQNENTQNIVILPAQIASAPIAAGAKLLWGRCAAQANAESGEIIFKTRELASDLGCHVATIFRRKELLMKQGLLEYTGKK